MAPGLIFDVSNFETDYQPGTMVGWDELEYKTYHLVNRSTGSNSEFSMDDVKKVQFDVC